MLSPIPNPACYKPNEPGHWLRLMMGGDSTKGEAMSDIEFKCPQISLKTVEPNS